MPRIAVAGFQHETNTFAPFQTDYRAFEIADGWPALAKGPAIFDAVAGANIPIEGFIQTARRSAEIVPVLWTSAEPGGHVTETAFERIAGGILSGIAAAGSLDGVYLDLHGAMVPIHTDDGEGELLSRIRRLIGPNMPLVASLDFHANITQRMVDAASAMTIYRTYPHVDMAAAGARAAEVLFRLLRMRRSPGKAFRQGPYLIPLHEQCTMFEPNRSLFGILPDVDKAGLSADMALGFPPSDIRDCGPSVIAYAETPERATGMAQDMLSELLAAEKKYRYEILSSDTAIARAKANRQSRPVILADTQDNPGAGGTGDTTGALADLVRHGAQRAVISILIDGAVAAQAHQRGVGATFEAALGGNFGGPGANPFRGRFRVDALGSGKFTCTGPVGLGARCDLGPMALLAVANAGGADVKIVVSSTRFQPLDQEVLRHVGVEPAAQRILVLKSSVHFRADFDPVAAETLVVEWPGSNPADPRRSDYRKLRPGVRLTPNGPVFSRIETPRR